jgi:tRNA modification GTPase
MSEFAHKTYEIGQTVAAVATPPGEGGIAIIRIAGYDALDIANKVFSRDITRFASHTANYGRIIDESNATVDEVLVLVMLGNNSFTGEDTVEIHCHGGVLITRKVLKTVLAAGARPALPGEFSFKAFQNGKIDLTRAEAIQELISAKSEMGMLAAENQLQGRLYDTIRSFQTKLFDLAAILEAWVDFPEEGLEFASFDEVIADLTAVKREIALLENSFHDGRVISTRLSLCLLGEPNAGKSSLLNALTGRDRAIVTHIPGTTRDILEEDIEMGGLAFRLIDTAGIRETDELIEKEGIRRAKLAAKEADLILLVVDATQGIEDTLLHSLPEEKTLIAWNKTDLDHTPPPSHPNLVSISAKEGAGLESLKEAISAILLLNGVPTKEEVTITQERHFQAICAAKEALDRLITGLKEEISPEFLSIEMRTVLRELGTIIGANITEDLLSAIFSKFCVGK